ncbi:holin [Klebsiella oxytoca]|uniref:holin n=1 Tax=Klebsiella TaxID=570 RepID=UPI00254EF407|nr:holin [Klebsiella oxytoca]MDK8001114.1 holin [Klebsiella oxytoca]MDK8044135.1 holin [Klebsiella oxytoca]HEJ9370912.1 holin [Klebsiella oxytoca]
MLGAWALLLLLFGVGAAVELARVLNSDEQITMRLIVSRMLAGAVTAVLALLAKFKHPDIEDLAVVGLGAAAAVVGYTALQPALKKLLKALSRVNLSDDSGRKGDD